MTSLWGVYHYNKTQEVSHFEILNVNKKYEKQTDGNLKTTILGTVGLAQYESHHRLRYPLGNESESLFLVFDGFISNHDQLRDMLIKQGHRFNSREESGEVVLHLFEQDREEGFKKLNGMFAFVIWDDRAKELIMVRDRFGTKPLYYYDNGESLFFSSNIKSILSMTGFDYRLNPQAFYDYLSLSYVPFSQTMFLGIEKLPAKSYMRRSRQYKTIKLYWDFQIEPEFKIEQEQIEAELSQRLREAIKVSLPNQESPGVFLSGGLDSGAIAYYLKSLGCLPIETFGVSFEEKAYDEGKYGKIIAECLETKHRIVYLDNRFIKDFDKIINCFENLHAETSIIPFYYLAEYASHYKNCILSGESGDEFLGGYPEMLADKLLPYYKRIPSWVRKTLFKFLAGTLPVSDAPVGFDYKFKHFIRGAEQDLLRAHFYWRTVFTEEEKFKLLSRDFFCSKKYGETFERYSLQVKHYYCNDMLKTLQFGYFNVLIPENNIPFYDAICETHSVDIRYPFLDYRLVDFMLRIPMSMKLRGLTTKYILRHLLKNKLPRSILSRKKHGLSCPIKIWIKGKMKDIFLDRLSEESLKQYPYLNAKYVQQLLKEHLGRKVDNSRKIWCLFCFVVWHSKYFGKGVK